MIPKIIHYCWFGKGLMPHSQKQCIEGWKKLMPDYTIMRWDESAFPLDKYPLAKCACEVKKYALASDVCRYNVLAEYGGIYLDTDVEVYKRFDEFLQYNFFTGIELYNEFETEHIREQYLNPDGTAKDPTQDVPRLEVLTSSMGCCPNNKMICDLRDYYNSAEATPERALHYREWVNNDRLVARYLTQYGFRYVNETQHLQNNMVVFGTGTFGHAFCPDQRREVSYHYNAATWETERWTHKQHWLFFLDKFNLLPVYKRYKTLRKKLKRLLLQPRIGEIWCLHRVVPQRSAYPSNRALQITPDYLETLINDYRNRGYRFLSLDDFLTPRLLLACYFNKKRCVITFDDGFKDVYQYAFPILKRERIPFTIYLTTDMPDGKAFLWWEQLERECTEKEDFEAKIKHIYEHLADMQDTCRSIYNMQPDLELTKQLSLSWSELKEMVDSGLCTIGCHTKSHAGLSRISLNDCKNELQYSRERIKEKLGIDVCHLSYPHSMMNDLVVRVVTDAGFSTAALGYGGKVHNGYEPYAINREFIVMK